MANKNKNKVNQPPTGEGKKQNPQPGAPEKLHKRSIGAQAQHGHGELNLGTDEDEAAATPRPPAAKNPKRPKAGR
ncbi:MAG TPA: hypothetical protein VE775_08760 [Pyrinomonadaceae bacterium]|nr:hypothetical protein [Pyrinomonadaceae bacterium]